MKCLLCKTERAGRVSGYCERCLLRLRKRRWRRNRNLSAALGEALPLEWVAAGLEANDPKAISYAHKLVVAILSGDLSFVRRPKPNGWMRAWWDRQRKA